ncbi:recombinase family protein [Sphingomonas rubra]|uniref:Site-specific DNA recombinase n=1 Tax=Sphingomonas rubra TaxID=634430 RepID=A0A1I5S712_9SPHN|nr:recombinase family protein [Sphingomonas rubra]SFP66588.1 Site-specific DNA recombinase [Sphingomonas rubra]
MQAIRYHRFSSKRQDRGSTLARQDKATRELCEAKGWTVVETLEDCGQSAWKGDHLSVGKLGELRKRIDAGLIPAGTVIVVENLDRLSRQDYRTARRWIEDVTDREITVAVCSPALLLDREAMSGSNIGSMIQHLLEANRATAESQRKSTFQRSNLERMTGMIRSGICPTPRVPAWLKGVVGEPLTIIDERAAVVQLIYEWSASGMGLQAICQRLNASHEPWSAPGWKTGASQWRIGYVRDILRAPAVEGKYVVNGPGRQPTGEVITGYYPRIVDADLVDRARAAIDKRAGTGGQNASEAQNYFVGLVTCKHCSGAVGRVKGGKGYAYLECRNARYGTCSNRGGMNYAILSKAVVDHLLHLALNDTHFAAVDDIAPLMARVSQARSKIATLETEQTNLLQAIRRLSASDALIGELERIEGELVAAKAALTQSEDAVAIARGTVSPAEHLSRVRNVSASLETSAEARRMVRDALPAIIDGMVWDGRSLRVSSPHFMMTIGKDGSISGLDLFHPRNREGSPDYARRRDAAIEAGTFLPYNDKGARSAG